MKSFQRKVSNIGFIILQFSEKYDCFKSNLLDNAESYNERWGKATQIIIEQKMGES